MGQKKLLSQIKCQKLLGPQKDRERDEDKKLVKRIKNGDTKAFELLMNKYKQYIFNFCYGYFFPNVQKSEDAAQDIFINAYKGLNKFREDSEFKTFLYSIAKNTCLNIINKNRRKKSDFYDVENIEEIKDQRAGDVKEKKEDIGRLVHKVLKKLKFKCRMLIFLKLFQDFKFKDIAELEIAESLGIRSNCVETLKSAFYGCLKAFRKEYLAISTPI